MILRPLFDTALAAALLSASAAAVAQHDKFEIRCRQWLDKKGYSVDYIEQRAGKRQEGNGSDWRGNVDKDEVQPGDVVIEWVKQGQGRRAAYVEDVLRGADGKPTGIVLSEWNRGKMVDAGCHITSDFGKLSPPRTIAPDDVVRVWRPSKPL